MVVRTRARAILYPIAFYVVLGVASGYLVWGAWNGERGLKTKAEYASQMQSLDAELKALAGRAPELGAPRRADALGRRRPRSSR